MSSVTVSYPHPHACLFAGFEKSGNMSLVLRMLYIGSMDTILATESLADSPKRNSTV